MEYHVPMTTTKNLTFTVGLGRGQSYAPAPGRPADVIPAHFTGRAVGDGWEAAFTITADATGARITAVQASGAGLTADALDLAGWLRAGIDSATAYTRAHVVGARPLDLLDEGERTLKVAEHPASRRFHLTDDHLREVADVYRAEVAAGNYRRVNKIIAAKFAISESTARGRVRLARDRGFLERHAA
jgi:hypothetical protein